MANDKVNDIVSKIKELSVVEAFELKKALEVEFDVKASAPMGMMAAAPAAAAHGYHQAAAAGCSGPPRATPAPPHQRECQPPLDRCEARRFRSGSAP